MGNRGRTGSRQLKMEWLSPEVVATGWVELSVLHRRGRNGAWEWAWTQGLIQSEPRLGRESG